MKKRIILKEEFLNLSKNKFNDKFDYSLMNYIDKNSKIILICSKHGRFSVFPKAHLHNKYGGCKKCSFEEFHIQNKEVIYKKFIEDSKLIHNNKYDYSKVNYQNKKERVCIICPIHGEFYKSPSEHLKGIGCQKCSNYEQGLKRKIFITDEHIEKAKLKYNNKYDYSLVDKSKSYSSDKVQIICPEHGIFEQEFVLHLKYKVACPKCWGFKLTNEEFIIECKNKFGNRFDYSLTNYINCYTKIKIKCNSCGIIFNIKPTNHLNNENGCPHCRKSRGELKIMKWLSDNNINFITQKKFNDCRGKKRPLPFDFYLPDLNICIEFDGRQHYERVNFRQSMSKREIEENYLNCKNTDRIKNNYCLNNKIPLIRIPYYSDVIFELETIFYLIDINRFNKYSSLNRLNEMLDVQNIGFIYKCMAEYELNIRSNKNIRNENDKIWIKEALNFWKLGLNYFPTSVNISNQIKYFEKL